MVPCRGVWESYHVRNLSFPVDFLDASLPDVQAGIYIGPCLKLPPKVPPVMKDISE